MNNPADSPAAACGQLADYLESHQDAMISAWVAEVRKDSSIPSEPLTKLEIIDHVPKIFEAIIHALRRHYGATTEANVHESTTRHTIVRWVQGYDLVAVLREAALLRATFLEHAPAHKDADENPGSGLELALSTINRIFDDIVRDATETFHKLRNHSG